MPTLGKVLAVFAFLLALGFVALVVMDYGQRRAWSGHVQRQDFAIHGLPMDENEKDGEGQPVVDLLSNQMLQSIFSGITGQQVKTQQAEVQQRRSAIQTELSGLTGNEKKARARDILLPLCATPVERNALAAQIARAQDADFGDQGPLLGPDSLFDAAYQAAANTKNSIDHRRQAAAHFLFSLSSRREELERTMAIVGLEAYGRAVQARAGVLARMVPAVNLAIEEERTVFVSTHQALMRQIISQAEQIRSLHKELINQEAVLNDYVGLVGRRREDKQSLEDQIKAARASLAATLKEQDRLEKLLAEANEASTATAAENQKLERELRNLELGQ